MSDSVSLKSGSVMAFGIGTQTREIYSTAIQKRWHDTHNIKHRECSKERKTGAAKLA